MRPLATSVLLCACLGCGGSKSNPGAPTPTPTPTPPPQTFTLNGTVTESAPTTNKVIAGATIQVVDGSNAGKFTSTNASGQYSLDGMSAGGYTVNFLALGYQTTGRGVTTTGTLNVGLVPNLVTMTETFTGTISGGDSTCSDGTFTKACKIVSLPIHNAGLIDARLDWSPNSVADLDLSLFRSGTTTPIARSTSAIGGFESVSANVAAGFTYELHITYYTGSNITTYTLRTTHPN